MKLSARIQSRVKQDSLERATKAKIDLRANLYIHDQVLEAGDRRTASALGVPIERDTALVFVDLAPAANWVHPCEYHLYDANTSKFYEKVKASLPPPMLSLDPKARTAFHKPVRLVDMKKRRAGLKKRIPPIRNAPSSFPGERYAILYAGKAENRHTNDLEFLYRTLIDVYGFNAANIQVCNHDGTLNYFLGPTTSQTIGNNLGNWPGDSTAYRMVVNHPGTRAGFQAACNAVAAQIRPEDFLFIHTNNHGGGVGDQGRNAQGAFNLTDFCMYAYDANGTYWIPYYVDDFIADLGVIPDCEALMVMMEQCRSGGFIDPIINNSPATWTHVATAVAPPDYSDGGPDFDPFAEDWIAAMHGHYPDGTGLIQAADANNDAQISAIEAFNYADAAVTGGDTPTAEDSPAGYGAYLFLGLPAHDLYLRDNLQDHGREPLINGGIACSPDIIVFNQQLLDPEVTLGTPAAQQSDTLGSMVESGQDNYIYLRVQNRGAQPTDGTARLFWAPPSALPAPASWTEITDPSSPAVIPSINSNEMKIVGPIVWKKGDIPPYNHQQGNHYCFVGLINSGNDPAPDPATIHTVDDYYNFIRRSNNATWKNFDVVDMFANSVSNMAFAIEGWPYVKLSADLMIDLRQLPANVKVTLRMPRRLSSSAQRQNAKLIKETANFQQFQLTAGGMASLCNMNLKASDHCQATLEITVPKGTPDGSYRLSAAEVIDGKEMGSVTRMLAVGQYPYMGNRRSHEVHIAGCEWVGKMGRGNKEAFQEVERALKRGYDGCRFCLPEYSKD